MLTARTIPLIAALAITGAAHAQFGTGPMAGTKFSTVARGTNSAIDRPGLYQFHDEVSMRNHFQRFGLDGALPAKVDWFANQVLIIHLGQRSSGGYSVYLGAVEKQPNNRVKITAVESTPIKGQMTTQALTSPYVVVAIEKGIPGFDLVWTKREGNGILAPGSIPPGSTVFTYPGNVTILNPLIGGWGLWGGDYYSDCSTPNEFWIGNNDELFRYCRRYLGNVNAIPPNFDWRTERLLAVHLGARGTAVSIEAINFERRGDRGTLWLAEAPARIAQPRRGAPISPFVLVRVARDVRSVKVNWAKKDR